MEARLQAGIEQVRSSMGELAAELRRQVEARLELNAEGRPPCLDRSIHQLAEDIRQHVDHRFQEHLTSPSVVQGDGAKQIKEEMLQETVAHLEARMTQTFSLSQ